MIGTYRSYLFCAAYRLATIFFIRTWFVPDEFWQGPEVAHKMVFGYGYLTWEWTKGIRSYVYPLLIAAIYKVLEILRLDTTRMLVESPRVMQALLSAVGDYYFIKWCRNTTRVLSAWPYFMILTNWFWMYCATRTLSNTVETVLTIIALYLYPWGQAERKWTDSGKIAKPSDKKPSYLWFVGLACIVRPSAATVWSPLVSAHLFSSVHLLDLVARTLLPTALVLMVVSTAVDSFFQNQFTVTWLNFFNANVVQDIGGMYGTHPWYWYIVVGMPVVLGIQIVPLIWRFFLPYIPGRYVYMDSLLITSIWCSLAVFSFLPHKEFRFLLPLVPMCLHLATTLLVLWSNFASKTRMRYAAFTMFFFSMLPAIYTGLYHQRGVMDLMPLLAREAQANPATTDLLFLMPCHSTPLYSHLHVNIPIKFLTCEPDFDGIANYTDEADIFYENPEEWLNQNYPASGKLPSHIICFDVLAPKINAFFHSTKYHLGYELWHTHFPSGRVGANVQVYVKLSNLDMTGFENHIVAQIKEPAA